MDKILHDPKDPKLWELWYIPFNGSCRILSISRTFKGSPGPLNTKFHLILKGILQLRDPYRTWRIMGLST